MIGPLFAYRPDDCDGATLAPLAPRKRIGAADRRCFRCADCLDVLFAGEDLAGVACGACGGALESMGRVNGLRLEERHHACACDGRCTSAVGPACDCHCGGENHGTGRTVEVRRDLGPVPTIRGQRHPEELRAVAAEWRAGVSSALDRIASLPRGSNGAWWARRYLAEARELRTHKARMLRVAKILSLHA